MNRTTALILAGGRGERLGVLTEERAKPALPFGGKYRIIDFTLSNCTNSGIDTVGVLTQYRPRSLNEHIGTGRPWDLDRSRGGVTLLQPYEARSSYGWYKGTAHAVYQNLPFLEKQKAEEILILSGDHIYNMDYRQMLAFHRAKGAHLTVGVSQVPIRDASRFGILSLNDDDRVTAFEEKPAHPKGNTVSMGIYVFDPDVLCQALEDDVCRSEGNHDFGKDILPRLAGSKRVFGYRFGGYWRDVGTVASYWQANMDLLDGIDSVELGDPEFVIHTKSAERAPAKFGHGAAVSNSLISNGCVVEGTVRHSVLSPGVVVHRGAVVTDSIVLDNTVLGPGSSASQCILDKEVWVGAGTRLGVDGGASGEAAGPGGEFSGITVVGKRARIPAGYTVGRDCQIHPSVRESDFTGAQVASGATVVKRVDISARVA